MNKNFHFLMYYGVSNNLRNPRKTIAKTETNCKVFNMYRVLNFHIFIYLYIQNTSACIHWIVTNKTKETGSYNQKKIKVLSHKLINSGIVFVVMQIKTAWYEQWMHLHMYTLHWERNNNMHLLNACLSDIPSVLKFTVLEVQ